MRPWVPAGLALAMLVIVGGPGRVTAADTPPSGPRERAFQQVALRTQDIETLKCRLEDRPCLDRELILRDRLDQFVRIPENIEGDCLARLGFRTSAGCELPMAGVDRRNIARVRAIVARWGLPHGAGWSKPAVLAAWRLSQHAYDEKANDIDVAFQASILPQVRDAVRSGQLPAYAYADMFDRVALGEGRPQSFGTQFRCRGGKAEFMNLEAPDAVDARRATLDLPPWATIQAYAASNCASSDE